MMGGVDQLIERSQMDKLEPMEASLMTPNLQSVMSKQELVDLVEYMRTLKKEEALQ